MALNDPKKIVLTIHDALRQFFSKLGCRGPQFLLIGQKWYSGRWRAGIKKTFQYPNYLTKMAQL